jgi:hypothetical protein
MDTQATEMTVDFPKTRAELIASMKRWAAFALPNGTDVDTPAELAADFVVKHAASPATEDGRVIEQLSALNPTTRSLVEHLMGLGLLVKRLAEFSRSLPPSKGYQPLLAASCGLHPTSARLLSHIITRHGEREARDASIFGDVVRAIRFLSKSERDPTAVREKIAFLLASASETTVLEPIMPNAVDENGFIQLLETAARNGQTQQLTERCAELSRQLAIKRGPKRSAASFAHQFLLEHLPGKQRAYTYTSDVGFTDKITEATRLEFGHGNFDPRPARRRIRAASPR